MKEFENWYRRHPKMNFTGYGKFAWEKAKERDRKIWEAALKWIYYEGVLDPSLAGDLIKEELPDGSV